MNELLEALQRGIVVEPVQGGWLVRLSLVSTEAEADEWDSAWSDSYNTTAPEQGELGLTW